jgi:hypothetical protein
MDKMQQVAFHVVQRACLFGALAIFCVMFGLSFEPLLAMKAGGTMTVVMSGVLAYKAQEARTKPYRKTEMWLCLPKDARPPDAYAQRISATILRDTYLNFAFWTAAVALAMWIVAFGLSVAGF